LQENNATKWFCGFTLTELAPDYSVFSKICAPMSISLLSNIFTNLREQLKQKGVMNEVSSFVDASHLIAKVQLYGKSVIKLLRKNMRN